VAFLDSEKLEPDFEYPCQLISENTEGIYIWFNEDLQFLFYCHRLTPTNTDKGRKRVILGLVVGFYGKWVFFAGRAGGCG
jgi:hypothetical protein